MQVQSRASNWMAEIAHLNDTKLYASSMVASSASSCRIWESVVRLLTPPKVSVQKKQDNGWGTNKGLVCATTCCLSLYFMARPHSSCDSHLLVATATLILSTYFFPLDFHAELLLFLPLGPFLFLFAPLNLSPLLPCPSVAR